MLFFSYAAKTSGQKKDIIEEPQEEKMSSIPITGTRNRDYFSGIDEKIIALVEDGSPFSIQSAIQALRKVDGEYKENEKVLMYIASSIMQTVWVYEKIDREIPSVGQETPYAGAISSVCYGVYDTSTGKVDFFATLLPSLVIAKTENVKDFYQDAEADLLSCKNRRPDSVLVNYLLGLLYKKNGNSAKANPLLLKAYDSAPDCFQCAFEYSENLRLLGKTKDSYEVSRKLLEKYPKNPSLLELNAKTSFSLKDYSSAEEYVSRILQQNPSDLAALLFRITILVEKKDYIHAASLLDVYSREDSTSRNYFLLRAKVQYDWSKNTTGAIATIEAALRMYPDDKELQLFAAKLANAANSKILGKSSEDIANAILASEPANETALRYSVEGLIRRNEWKKAYEKSSILVTNFNSDRESVFLHIKICLAVGKNDEAWNLISPLYRANGNDEAVIQSYITVLQATNRTSLALSLINQLLPDASSKMKSFLFYRRSLLRTREDDILSDLRSSLIANPRNSDSLFSLYEIYDRKSDYRKAQYYLKQVVALNPNDPAMRVLNDALTLKIEGRR